MNLFGEVGNLFIICKGTEDELKSSNITTMLDDIGFPKHRLLFCNTEKGKIAMVRQIVPRYVCMYVCVHSYNQSSHIKHVFNPFTCMSVCLFVCLFVYE